MHNPSLKNVEILFVVQHRGHIGKSPKVDPFHIIACFYCPKTDGIRQASNASANYEALSSPLSSLCLPLFLTLSSLLLCQNLNTPIVNKVYPFSSSTMIIHFHLQQSFTQNISDKACPFLSSTGFYPFLSSTNYIPI